MIYLIMCGRLGNQLFQYSFARMIQEETGQELAIDFTAISNVHKTGWINYLDYYNVNHYNIVEKNDYYPLQRYIYKFLKTIRPRTNEYLQFIFDEISAHFFSKLGVIFYESDYQYYNFKNIKAHNIIIRGWFESEKYFNKISQQLAKELVPRNIPHSVSELASILGKKHGVCLSVRRGNFTDPNLRDKFLVCTPAYYEKAVELIKKIHSACTLYICSDDIEWCKKTFDFSGEVIFEPQIDVHFKLYLMSRCTDFILSNSTFSWWAQYLSFRTNNMVIAPSIWRNTVLPPKAIFSDDWILLDRNGEIVK